MKKGESEMTHLVRALRDDKETVVFFTGAGMSTESGLPDFRSAKRGLWGAIDPMEVASIEALNERAESFFQFYAGSTDHGTMRKKETEKNASAPHLVVRMRSLFQNRSFTCSRAHFVSRFAKMSSFVQYVAGSIL